MILVAVALVGCAPANPEAAAVANANKTNSQRLANLYILHQFQNAYAGPADEAAFKEFIKKTDPRTLQPMGVDPDTVDDLFVSERDGQPFKIKYGIESGPHGCQEPAIFEATGQNGKRMVGFLNMVQKEVENAEYDQLFGQEATVTESARGDN